MVLKPKSLPQFGIRSLNPIHQNSKFLVNDKKKRLLQGTYSPTIKTVPYSFHIQITCKNLNCNHFRIHDQIVDVFYNKKLQFSLKSYQVIIYLHLDLFPL